MKGFRELGEPLFSLGLTERMLGKVIAQESDPYAGYSYYVNSVTGSDDNPGTSSLLPFASLTKLMTVWQAGQSAGLAKGSTWRGQQLTVPGNGCTIAAYGIGNRPIIDCSSTYANNTFTKTAGQTVVYQVDTSTNYIASESSFVGVWENNVRFTLASSLANCNATASSYYVANHNATSITVYVHASDNSDITANGKTYDISNRGSGIYAYTATGGSITGIHVKRNYYEGGGVKVGPGITVTDCWIKEGNKHNALGRAGSNWINNLFEDAYYTSSATLLVINEDSPNLENSNISGCAFRLTSISLPGVANVAPINSHNNVGGYFGTFTIADCTFENLVSSGTMFGFNHASQIVMTNPVFLNCFGLSGPAAALCNTGCNFTVSGGSWGGTVANLRAVNLGNAGNAPLVISGMTITMDALPSSGLVFVNANVTLSITNCIFKSNLGSGSRMAIYLQNCASANITLNNNTYHTGTGGWLRHYYFAASASGMTWASDNNTFKIGGAWGVFGTDYAPLAVYQVAATVTPRDAASVAV